MNEADSFDVLHGFSAVVKKHREKLAMSRASLAEKSGLHQTYIGLLERGQRSPNLETARAIAKALGLSLSSLIKETEKRSGDGLQKDS